MVDSVKTFDAPIPGENFTSDTKNYPWHRPPDITDYDEAINDTIKMLSGEQQIKSVMALLGAEVSLPTIVDMVLTGQIANGKIPIDLGILIAGPVARFLEIMAKMYDIDYTMGKDDEPTPPTAAYLKKVINQNMEDVDVEETEVVSEALTTAVGGTPEGLMGAPDEIEQERMLGRIGSIEEDTEEEV